MAIKWCTFHHKKSHMLGLFVLVALLAPRTLRLGLHDVFLVAVLAELVSDWHYCMRLFLPYGEGVS